MNSVLPAVRRSIGRLVRLACTTILPVLLLAASVRAGELDYQRARWHPSHFSPQIERASDDQCLACHREILTHRPRQTSPAGVSAAKVLAWYQTLDTYTGEQSDFHVRHLQSAYAKEVMALKCTTCHQGNDPREEAVSPPTSQPAAFTLRKMVDPNTCLMCHGRMQHEIMGLPSAWPESREMFGNNCLTCHAAIRTVRHQVDFLKAENIEKLGAADGDVCYGCHGGRQWYRIGFPYPRHPWPGMADEVPDWAKGRPAESAPRHRIDKTNKTTSAGSNDDASR
ncbi:MAG: hypothetical protein IPJ21_04645 [Sterolibacteriaceae bacterium]|jgi:nitrate/TMAO reductase-like tetraheme cytochrome c subunit|nr:hypothetical protein [Sterolibacteriaceae bacterium]MBK9086944.1 hypothetical protein [Sterolibacteriaceae bacterium]